MVPAGTKPFLPFSGVNEKLVAVQITVVMVVITGLGFTKTVAVNELPVQVPNEGTTVYTAVCVLLLVLNKLPVMVVV